MLKKLTTALLACTVLALPQAFALSVLPEAGVSLGVGTKEQYAEAKVLPRTTIGYKRAARAQEGRQRDVSAQDDVALCDLCQRLAFRRNPGRPQLQHRLRLGSEHQLP